MRIFEVNVLSGVRLSRFYLAGDAQEELGADRVYLQRIGDSTSRWK